jgi:hypothetical protein
MLIARQWVAKHISAKPNARNNKASIAKQRRSKQALSAMPAVFSVGSVQSGYKRFEFRNWSYGRMKRMSGRMRTRMERVLCSNLL